MDPYNTGITDSPSSFHFSAPSSHATFSADQSPDSMGAFSPDQAHDPMGDPFGRPGDDKEKEREKEKAKKHKYREDAGKYYALGPMPEVEILELKPASIRFKLTKCTLSIANALRRIMIAEVPTLAFDFIDLEVNTSVLDDEFIAHRLGLIPLRSDDVGRFKYARDCDCEDGCPFCSVLFNCDQVNNRAEERVYGGEEEHNAQELHLLVHQGHINNDTPETIDEDPGDLVKQKELCRRVMPVADSTEQEMEENPIVLVKLANKQRVRFTCVARKGIGKEHAKFQPVSVVAFQHVPRVEIDLDQVHEHADALDEEWEQQLAKVCPSKVFKVDSAAMPGERLQVEKEGACTYCNECLGKLEEWKTPDIVKISMVPDSYILNVETTGALPPEDVVIKALDILRDKLIELRDNVKQLKR